MHRPLQFAYDRAPDAPASTTVVWDRAPSNRYFDDDGRLHIRLSHITKANVCPYYGREIPDSQALGLDANKIYRLYRDPEALKAGAATANNIQLLTDHVPVTAKDHRPTITAGSTGTDASFNPPYLDQSLVVWDQVAIDNIVNDTQRELSCCYRYRAVMEPGIIDGVAYDGRMVDIRFNHVALVPRGRAGSDVLVSDSRLEIHTMALASKKALQVSGALAVYLAPKMAADAKLTVDMDGILAGVTRKTYAADKSKIVERLNAAVTAGKITLAADADIKDAAGMLDALDMVGDGEPEQDEIKPPAPAVDPAKPAPVVDPAKPAPAADPAKPATPPEPQAMDAAAIEQSVMARMNGIFDARALVRPIIGELQEAPKTEAAVYIMALDAKGVDHTGVTETAGLKALVKQALATTAAPTKPAYAADAAARKSFEEEFLKGAQQLVRS